jgi:serralysin
VSTGAVQTASGYDIAWKIPGANQYTAWTTDSNGNYLSNIFGAVSGNSPAPESLEPTFNQDLNGDGVVGLYAVPGTTLQISQSLPGASAAASIGAGATLELAAAYSGSITFSASPGMLKLDNPSTFTGQMSNFTGNGSLSGSDQIDLKTISYNSVHDSYGMGVLTVTDGTNSAALYFNGSYTSANFKFANDGNGGTIVYDPPLSNSLAARTNSAVTADHGNDVFLFHPNLGQTVSTDHAFETGVHVSQAEFASASLAIVHDAQENVIFADAAHDTISLHNHALAQQHHSGFLI